MASTEGLSLNRVQGSLAPKQSFSEYTTLLAEALIVYGTLGNAFMIEVDVELLSLR